MLQDVMDSGSVTPGSTRKVRIERHHRCGFGFVAGGEKPVVVRSVFTDGPANGKLLPGDQILAVDEVPVSDFSRKRVIDLVRSCKESIALTVLQPFQSHKSAFISAAKKAHLRTNPNKVRFSEQVYVSDPESVPRLLHPEDVFITLSEQESTIKNPGRSYSRALTWAGLTAVSDWEASASILNLCARRLPGRTNPKYIFLKTLRRRNICCSSVVQRTYFQGMKCLFRICFFPKDPADLLRRDPAAFEYLYIQSRNDVIKERCGTDWKLDVVLKLAALHIFITVSSARPNQKISLKYVEKEWGLEPFLPLNLLPSIKEKNVCKSLAQLLKTYQHPPPSGNKVPPLQGKLQYLRVLNDLPPFGCLVFHTVGLGGKPTATDLIVGPQHGIGRVVDPKNNVTAVLAEFRSVAKVQLFQESQSVARVEVSVLDGKPLVLLMDWPDASNFACLIAGYYSLYVDPKKVIYCQSPEESHITKADYRHDCAVPWPALSSLGSDKKEEAAVRDGQLKSQTPRDPQRPPELCQHLSNEKEQLQELRHRGEDPANVNEKGAGEPQRRLWTKAGGASFKASEHSRAHGRRKLDADFRDRAKTLPSCQQPEYFFCDSCKAKLKAAAEVHGSRRSAMKQRSVSCESCYASAVDLVSLPLPGRKEGEEAEDEDRGKAPMPAPSTIAAPPPGFQDNSSDEDDVKKERAGRDGAPGLEALAEVPVTLIDGVATRAVKDRAKELDDALLSTLQALEALAVSEDYTHHFQQPPHATGLIVLAAITPESSRDPSHESNPSELADVSEMMLAKKQNQNPTYLLAHHINTDCIFSHGDFPLPIPNCNKENLERGIGCEICTARHPKQLVFGKSVTPRLGRKAENAILTPAGKPWNLGNSKRGIASETTVELNLNEQSEWTQPTEDQKDPSAGLSADMNKRRNDEKISTSSTDITENNEYGRQKMSGSPSPESTLKASPIRPLVDDDNNKIRPASSHQEARSATCNPNSTSGSKGLFSDDLFCTCSFQATRGLSDTAEVAVYHSSSPTDDERLHAKAKAIQADSNKEHRGPGFNVTKDILLAPANSSPVTPVKAMHTGKTEVKNKSFSEPQKCSTSLCGQAETAKVASPASSSRKRHHNKTKSQCTGALLSFRNFFSATFPALQRHDTDQQRDHLQKARQYKLDFPEQLLKPGTAYVTSRAPLDAPCFCEAHTTPLQKIPEFSWEQQKSCDGTKLRCGYPLPDTQVGFTLNCNEQESTLSQALPLVSNKSYCHEGLSRSQSLGIKTTRIHSTSWGYSEHRGESSSCLPSCTSHPKCIGDAHYGKFTQNNSTGDVDGSEQTPVYAKVRTVKKKKEEKEMETISTTSEPTYDEVVYGKRKGFFSILSKERLKESQVETGKVMVELHNKDDNYCSFCFCYPKCEEAYKTSENDELSCSFPLEAMQLSVVSNALQVLEAEDCRGEEATKKAKDQSHEIDLRASSTLEGSLKRVEILQQKTFSLPSAFFEAQLDANELLAILRQFAHSLQTENKPQLQTRRLREYKLELGQRFKEFRVSCQRMAGVEKSPVQMLSAISASFQVLCSLMQTFIWLLHSVHSEGQRLQLLCKVEEVALNYSLLLRAAEESISLATCIQEDTTYDSPLCVPANLDVRLLTKTKVPG
ncbi:FERM and PDZ domain-containing protein 3-like [Arapaima gigas]